jgi:ubiquitin-like protein Pup
MQQTTSPTRRPPQNTTPTQRTVHDVELIDEMDELLDEIDRLLEESTIVRTYLQRGGQ